MEFLMEIGNVMMFNGRDSMQNVVMDMDSLSLAFDDGANIDGGANIDDEDEMRWVY